MDLFLRCDHTDPPSGRLRRLDGSRPGADGGAPEADPGVTVEFSGWLGLLRALSDALTESEHEQIPPLDP